MKTALILYGTAGPDLTRDHQSVCYRDGKGTYAYHVRVQPAYLQDHQDLADALDLAEPQPGETVLNTVWAKETGVR